jgi:hypothetical protein
VDVIHQSILLIYRFVYSAFDALIIAGFMSDFNATLFGGVR